jgi:hypothetical protein
VRVPRPGPDAWFCPSSLSFSPSSPSSFVFLRGACTGWGTSGPRRAEKTWGMDVQKRIASWLPFLYHRRRRGADADADGRVVATADEDDAAWWGSEGTGSKHNISGHSRISGHVFGWGMLSLLFFLRPVFLSLSLFFFPFFLSSPQSFIRFFPMIFPFTLMLFYILLFTLFHLCCIHSTLGQGTCKCPPVP